YHRQRANGQANAFVIGLSKTLIQVARYNGVDGEKVGQLKSWAAKLPDIPFDLTEKNKALLRQLEPAQIRAKLLFLPERLWAEVEEAWKAGRFRLVDAQCALAIDILLAMPLRPQNLSSLHWQRHFQELDTSGRLLLHIPAEETKTKRKELVAEIPEDVA